MSRSFAVAIDTREKKPWELLDPKIIEHEVRKLDTGDYTVIGLEDKLCIDRKASVSEIATNITQKRFVKELERIKEFPHAFIIIEATAQELLDYPHSSDLPPKVKNKIRINGKFLMKCLTKMQIKYGFNVIFAGDRDTAETIAINLMADVLDLYESDL